MDVPPPDGAMDALDTARAALLGLHAALEPLLGTDIAELDANPDPVHRARTAQALATAAASLIRTAEGAAGRPLAAGEGVGAELAAVARAARAAARLEVALASGGGGGERR